MAVITTGSHPKALWPGVYGWFGAKYNVHEKEYTQLFDIKSSSKNFEELVENKGFGLAPVKPEGSATVYEGQLQGYVSRFTHVAYSLGYVVTKEELADNLYGEVSNGRAENLAFSVRQTEENVGSNVYNRAFNATYAGGDAVELISNAHPSDAGNQSNIIATAADFSEAALEDLTIQIMNALSPKGLKISLRPTALIGPVNLVYDFERVLKSTLRVDSANNDLNALRSVGIIPKAVVNHYLTDTDAWFLRTDAPKGLCWFDRAAVEFSKDEDFDTDNAKAKCYRRFSTGWSDWRGLYASQGA